MALEVGGSRTQPALQQGAEQCFLVALGCILSPGPGSLLVAVSLPLSP